MENLEPSDVASDVLVIGSGIAGLSFALKIADFAQVVLITKKEKAESNTNYAQSGIAAVLSQSDSFETHAKDTLDCGDGLSKKEVVKTVVKEGPARIQELMELGVRFSRIATGELDFGDVFRVLRKEILVGLIMGLAMGGLIILRAWLLPPFIDFSQAIAVGTALSCVVIVATLVGAFFPLIIHKIGLDPAVMAGPLMTTIIDLAGLTIYFIAAKSILGL